MEKQTKSNWKTLTWLSGVAAIVMAIPIAWGGIAKFVSFGTLPERVTIIETNVIQLDKRVYSVELNHVESLMYLNSIATNQAALLREIRELKNK